MREVSFEKKELKFMVKKDKRTSYTAQDFEMRGGERIAANRASSLPLLILFLASSSLCIIIILLSGSVQAASQSATQKTSPANSQANNLTSSLTSPTAPTRREGKPSNSDVKAPSSIVEPQQEQSTDISASYVPIPIAQTNSDGLGETEQISSENEAAGESQSDSHSGSTWTGPWPKKFQIGYIKQSDLHQVLIESLKGDSFAALAGQSSKKPTATQTTSAPANKQFAGPKSQPETPKIPMVQWPQPGGPYMHIGPTTTTTNNNNKNLNSYKMVQQPNLPGRFPEMAFHSNLRPARPFNNQQKHNMFSMNNKFNNHRQQQFLFAAQPNFPKSNNQPIYGISNFEPNINNHKMLANFQPQPPSQVVNVRPQKSLEYFSQWRPMTEDRPANQVSSGVKQPDYQTIHDGFDDGFNAPSKDAQSEGPSMSRHPMLNNYINSSADSKQNSKLSPAMISGKMREQSQQKVFSTKGGTNPSQPGATKSGGEANLSVNRRRASNGTTITTTVSSIDVTENLTTISPTEEANSTTTLASTTSTGQSTPDSTTTQATETSTQAESETTEPDSESVNVDSNGEPGESTTSNPNSSTTTGTTNSVEPQDSSSKASASGRGSSESSLDSGEVVTQSSVSQQASGTASLPGVQDESQGSSTTPSSTSTVRSMPTPASTTVSNREETTPNSVDFSSTRSTFGASKGEVESGKTTKLDTMTDDALLAQTGTADIGKTNAQQARPKTAASSQISSKKTRSSERLVQPQQQPDKKGAASLRKTTGNLKKPVGSQLRASNGQRSAKQVGGGGGGSVKGGQKQETKSQKKNAAQRKQSNVSPSQKTTRMVQSERLQQQQVVSMSAAQAQSTAQTLASLLLSRCLSSSSCSHLLDICTTKQAMVALPIGNSSELEELNSGGNQSWSTPVGLMSNSLISLTQALRADKVLRVFPQWKDALENVMDQEIKSGYTVILPSNEAIDKLPVASVNNWLANPELLSQIIENHILDATEALEFGASSSTKMIKSKGIQVNQHRDKMMTINGKRVVYANQAAPSNGRIHVIEGILDWPATGAGKMLDIMDTLKQCDKFDGFVTLAEGTGLMQILKQDGPLTVFVPSNEALRKIPDEELDVIKNNNTALKEFLMYHVVNGSYFSQDLRDGQQLASILDMKPVQVGVRVDGCSRRLVEANTSPMRRPDIVAKNGVIHILDWYLTVRDNEWCDSMSGQQTASSTGNTMVPNTNSERLQQLASEQSLSYTSRNTMPTNHKPVVGELASENDKLASNNAGDFGVKNIIITATPIGDQNHVVAA